jgi:hypothetical protein
MMGMNRMLCSKMEIRFKDNKANTIRALTTPDAVFIPPHEIEEPDRRLKGFSWRINERPAKADVQIRGKVLPEMKPLKELKPVKDIKPVKKKDPEKKQDILGRSNPKR